MNKQKLIYSSSISATISALFVAVITVWAELSPALKGWLADWTGHHWVSKSILSLVIYFTGLLLFYLIPKQLKETALKSSLKLLLVATTVGAFAIFVFYGGHHLGMF